MTRRERLERKLEKREAWAASRRAKSSAASDRAHATVEGIPFGQPILVGHHSEGRHRRALERSDNAMRQSVEHADMAAHHAGKAAGLERQLEESIFSDDKDAIEQLEARIAAREAEAAWKTSLNKAYRKGGRDALRTWVGPDGKTLREETLDRILETLRLCPWLKVPCDTTNIRANIRRDKERIAQIRRQQERQQAAEDAGGFTITRHQSGWCEVTFAEKPAREILTALKSAGYRWGRGRWAGLVEQLPACVAALEEQREDV